MSLEHIVIVGAGHSGGCAAGALRTAGFAGRITLVGSEGHPPYERPPLSKELLANTIPIEKTYLHPVGWYQDVAIDLRLNTEVVNIDRASQRLFLSKDSPLPYDKLLLTTGARARTISFAKPNDPRVFYIRNIEEALAFRAQLKPGVRLAVIGAGFIGLEIAATACKSGCVVTVFERADQPLARAVPTEIGQYVASLHRDNGVNLQFSCTIESIDTTTSGCFVTTSGGRKTPADLICIGVGAAPNIELGAAAGLRTDDGIVVDEFGRTSDPHVFAAGDVTKHFNPLLRRSIRLESWQNAQNQAIAVAKVMAGGSDSFAEVPWLWTDQHGMNLQVAGAPVEWDELVCRGDPAAGGFTMFQMLQKKVVGAICVNSARDMRFARKLLSSRQPLDLNLLADKTKSLQELCG